MRVPFYCDQRGYEGPRAPRGRGDERLRVRRRCLRVIFSRTRENAVRAKAPQDAQRPALGSLSCGVTAASGSSSSSLSSESLPRSLSSKLPDSVHEAQCGRGRGRCNTHAIRKTRITTARTPSHAVRPVVVGRPGGREDLSFMGPSTTIGWSLRLRGVTSEDADH